MDQNAGSVQGFVQPMQSHVQNIQPSTSSQGMMSNQQMNMNFNSNNNNGANNNFSMSNILTTQIADMDPNMLAQAQTLNQMDSNIQITPIMNHSDIHMQQQQQQQNQRNILNMNVDIAITSANS